MNPFRCPVCLGNGRLHVWRDYGAARGNSEAPCIACAGKGIVWGPPLDPPPVKDDNRTGEIYGVSIADIVKAEVNPAAAERSAGGLRPMVDDGEKRRAVEAMDAILPPADGPIYRRRQDPEPIVAGDPVAFAEMLKHGQASPKPCPTCGRSEL